MTNTAFYLLVEELLEVEPGSLNGSERLADMGEWDSMALISFIAMADEKLGAVVSPRDIARCETVQDLFDVCAAPMQ